MEESWWDGTELTQYQVVSIINGIYWKFQVGGVYFYALVKSHKDTLPCVIDELKRVFRLPATGTRHIHLEGTLYILYRVHTIVFNDDCIAIVEEPTLNKVKLNQPWTRGPTTLRDECKKYVQWVYAFRDLIGTTINRDDVIHLRSVSRSRHNVYQGEYNPHPITYQDNVNLTSERDPLPKTVLANWFEGTTVTDIVCQLVGFTLGDSEGLGSRLAEYRNEIERTIMRVDRIHISLCARIMNRLSYHCQLTL